MGAGKKETKKRMDDSGVGRKDEANYHSHSRHVITLLTVVRPSTLSRALRAQLTRDAEKSIRKNVCEVEEERKGERKRGEEETDRVQRVRFA